MFKYLLDKVMEQPSREYQLSLIYMWVKQEHITKSEFTRLLDAVYSTQTIKLS
jgi:hypothetical protein